MPFACNERVTAYAEITPASCPNGRPQVQNSGAGVVCLQKHVVGIQPGIHEGKLFASIRSLRGDLEQGSILDARNDQPPGATE